MRAAAMGLYIRLVEKRRGTVEGGAGAGAEAGADRELYRQEKAALGMMEALAKGGDPRYQFEYARALLTAADESARRNKNGAKARLDSAASRAAAAAAAAEEIPALLDMAESAAAGGCSEAMYFMGLAHAKGQHGIAASDLAAVEWLARAAEAGHALAQFKLGVFAAHGRGVAQDWFMASEWYTAAAEAGVADAQFALGRLYATGRGVAKSHERACFWYSRGAQQGHGKAQFNLALRYTQGSGCVRDAARAAYWFGQAARRGVFGKGGKVVKGVLRAGAELDQGVTDTPLTASEDRRTVPQLVMRLSAFKAIRWNRNPSLFRKGSVRDRLGQVSHLISSHLISSIQKDRIFLIESF